MVWVQVVLKLFVNLFSLFLLMFGVLWMVVVYELMYWFGKDYEKLEFNIYQIVKDGYNILIVEQMIIEKLFCWLLCFKCYLDDVDVVM